MHYDEGMYPHEDYDGQAEYEAQMKAEAELEYEQAQRDQLRRDAERELEYIENQIDALQDQINDLKARRADVLKDL